ncbi:hypothetical protein DFR74_101204 [Nocardia puris]|uniref:Uncharacterized protein n=1 Tax=Nocardia puris TaxID=208602 RepID=A0A366E1K3_9NOCA|nr:hypothetical protein DFR74_101204 [Nocardia puris]
MNDRFLGRTSRRGTTRRHRSGDPRTPPRSDRVPNQCVWTHRDHSAHWSLHRTSPRENRFHSSTGHLPADRAGRLRIPHSGNGSRPIGANPTPSRTVPRHAHRTVPHHVRSTVRRPDRRIVPRHDRRTARHHARPADRHGHRTAPRYGRPRATFRGYPRCRPHPAARHHDRLTTRHHAHQAVRRHVRRPVPRHAHRTRRHRVHSNARHRAHRTAPHHAHSTTRPTVRPLVHRFAAHHAHRTAPHRSRDSRATPTAHPAASSVVPQHLPRRISHPACPDPSAIRSRERPAWPIRRRRPARSYPHLTNHSASARPSAHRRRNAHNPHRTSPRRTRSRPGTPDGASGATTASRTHPTTAPGASRAPRAQSSAAIIRFPCGCT